MHLQGRRVVVVKRESNTDLYYLCHSTEQAAIRRLLLLYEYKDDLPLADRLKFLHLFRNRCYDEAAELFARCSNEVIVGVEEFVADEAFINQGDAMEEVRIDLDAQIAELSAAPEPVDDSFEPEE